MKNDPITKLAFKLAGIYILVQAILFIPALYISIKMKFFLPNDHMDPLISESFIISIITFLILLILGLWLTFKNKIDSDKPMSAHSDLIQVGVMMAGIILFAMAFGDLANAISGLLLSPLFTFSKINIANFAGLIGSSIQLILGAILFFRSRFFAKLIK